MLTKPWFMALFISLTVVLFIGCGSNHLTRGKAADIINQQFKLPEPITTHIEVAPEVALDKEDSAMYQEFAKEGVIKYTFLRKYERESGSLTFYFAHEIARIELTDEGKKYVDNSDDSGQSGAKKKSAEIPIRLCKRELDEVTGIAFSKESNEADVEFTWKFTDFTPFGKHYKQQGLFGVGSVDLSENTKPHKASVRMRLYDDGWRVEGEARLPL